MAAGEILSPSNIAIVSSGLTAALFAKRKAKERNLSLFQYLGALLVVNASRKDGDVRHIKLSSGGDIEIHKEREGKLSEDKK